MVAGVGSQRHIGVGRWSFGVIPEIEMAQDSPDNFNDPGFKAAIQRAYGKENAPPALRDKVRLALAAQAASHSAPPRIAGKITAALRTRIAASILAIVGIGALAYQIYTEFWPHYPQYTPPSLSSDVIRDMVARHDASLNDPSFVTRPAADFPGIGKKLSAELGKTVASVPLGESWSLQGAATCMVGQTKSAQLLFIKGQTAVSLMSVPSEAGYSPPDGTRYDQQYSGHLLSGLVYKQVIYCLIASSQDNSLSVADLQALREKLATIIAPAADSCGTDIGAAAAQRKG